jgi:hypothetical protein
MGISLVTSARYELGRTQAATYELSFTAPSHTPQQEGFCSSSFHIFICPPQTFLDHPRLILRNLQGHSVGAPQYDSIPMMMPQRTTHNGTMRLYERITTSHQEVNIPNLTFLTNQGLFSYNHLLIDTFG